MRLGRAATTGSGLKLRVVETGGRRIRLIRLSIASTLQYSSARVARLILKAQERFLFCLFSLYNSRAIVVLFGDAPPYQSL